MPVITNILYQNEQSRNSIATLNDKPIKDVILNGQPLAFAEVVNTTSDAFAETPNCLVEPFSSIEIFGKSPLKNAPTFLTPSFFNVESHSYVKSSSINLFSAHNIEHKQKVDYEVVDDNSFVISSNAENSVAFVQTLQKGVMAGKYTFRYHYKWENAPDNSRANQILIWSIKDGVASIHAVFSHSENDADYVKTLTLPTCDAIRISFYACVNSTTFSNYKLTVSDVMLCKSINTDFTPYTGDELIKIPSVITQDNEDVHLRFLGVNGYRDCLTKQGSSSVIYRKRTDVITFTGEEEWSQIENQDGVVYFLSHSGHIKEQGLCSHFPNYSHAEQTDYIKLSEDGFYVKSSAHQSLEEFTNALKSESAKSTPVIVVFAIQDRVWDLTNLEFAQNLLKLSSKRAPSQIEAYTVDEHLPINVWYFKYKN